jgi:hypothetical protein
MSVAQSDLSYILSSLTTASTTEYQFVADSHKNPTLPVTDSEPEHDERLKSAATSDITDRALRCCIVVKLNMEILPKI